MLLKDRLKVEHRGGLLFHVTSESQADSFYIVDLEARDGYGECSCRDWQTRCSPRIGAGQPFISWPYYERTCCKHVHACFMFLGRRLAEEAARLNKG